MPTIIALAESIGCRLVISAIAWLRRLRGAPRMVQDFGVRYVVPVLVPIIVALLVLSAYEKQQDGKFHPHSSAPVVGMAYGLGIGLVVLIVWLVVDVSRFRMRPHDVRHVNGTRFRNR